ncbi:hypothetical protein [Fusibacter sp. A2]|nr:hypothetical protein [Fusibacter sp. A2]
MIKYNLGNPEEIHTLDKLRERLYHALESGKQHRDSMTTCK